MEKQDYVWVAVRIFGLYLLVEALFALLTVAGGLLQVCNFRDVPAGDIVTGLWRDEMHTSAVIGLWRSVFVVLTYSALGAYLTFGGKMLLRWICLPEEKKGEAMPVPPTPDERQSPAKPDQSGG